MGGGGEGDFGSDFGGGGSDDLPLLVQLRGVVLLLSHSVVVSFTLTGREGGLGGRLGHVGVVVTRRSCRKAVDHGRGVQPFITCAL